MRPGGRIAGALLLCSAALLLQACLSSPERPPREGGTDIDWVALAGQWPGEGWRATQRVSVVRGGSEDPLDLRVELEVSSARTAVLVSSLHGVPAFSMVVADGGMETRDAPVPLHDMVPLVFLADIVLAYWPVSVLQTAFEHSRNELRILGNERMVVDENGRMQVRVIRDSGPQGAQGPQSAGDGEGIGRMRVVHGDYPLELTIHTIEWSTL